MARIAIAKETISVGQMVNKGRKFYVRKAGTFSHGQRNWKLCNEPTNSSSIGDFNPDFVRQFFDIVDE